MGLLDVLDEIDETQKRDLGDHAADAVIVLVTGQTLRGHVTVDRSGNRVAIWQRLVAGGGGVPARSTAVLSEGTDGGTSEIPFHVRADFIVMAYFFGAGSGEG